MISFNGQSIITIWICEIVDNEVYGSLEHNFYKYGNVVGLLLLHGMFLQFDNKVGQSLTHEIFNNCVYKIYTIVISSSAINFY